LKWLEALERVATKTVKKVKPAITPSFLDNIDKPKKMVQEQVDV